MNINQKAKKRTPVTQHALKDELKLPIISVLVATYNRADYLHLCLACLCEQDYKGRWQIVIADDGSSDHTADIISEIQHKTNAPEILHCWHEHNLYRRAMIFNKASRLATGDLLIFLDSDCLAAVNLLSIYSENLTSNAFYLGGVYKLNRSFSQKTLNNIKQAVPEQLLKKAGEAQNQLKNQRKKVFNRYWKSKIYTLLNVRRPKIWGANFAVNRNVFEIINGFDENYIGWGQEDSDLRNRLVKGAYRAISLHTKALVYHLWHPVSTEARNRPSGEKNNRNYYKRPQIEVVCRNGLRKL